MRIRPEASEVWYGDKPRTGYRVLTADEAAQVRSAMLRYRWGSGILWALSPFLFLISLAALAFVAEEPGLGSLAMFAFIGVFVGIVVVARRWGQKGAGLKEDLAQGYVNQFKVGGQMLEVLPSSNRVWTVNGVWEQRYHDTVEQVVTASAPKPLPSNDVGDSPSDTTRYLTDDEIAELRRHARKAWLFAVSTTASVLLFWMFALFMAMANDFSDAPKRFGLFLLLSPLALAAAIYATRSALRLRRDIVGGIVLRDALLKGTYETANGVKETLPHSRLAWTVSGRSAPWRRD